MGRKKKSRLVSYNKIKEWLLQKGYIRVEQVLEKGDFSIRGNIVDVYPYKIKCPIRLEYDNDILETIRVYSLRNSKSKTIYSTTSL